MSQAEIAERRSVVYPLYVKGLSAEDISERTIYSYDEVLDLIWRWKILEAKEKARRDLEDKIKFSSNNIIIPKRNEGVSDFVLLTNNPEVEEAYARLVNPLKVNPIP